jgi:hypothetical protein
MSILLVKREVSGVCSSRQMVCVNIQLIAVSFTDKLLEVNFVHFIQASPQFYITEFKLNFLILPYSD